MSEEPSVVITNGSYVCKAGFAGEEAPRVVFPSVVGHVKPGCQEKIAKKLKECYVGEEVFSKRGICALNYPVQKGVITNWDEMEILWRHTFDNELKVEPDNQPVLLSEYTLNPKENTEKMTQIMFEKFNVPAMHIAKQEALSLITSGSTTGTVIDIGEQITRIVPFYEGTICEKGVVHSDIGGQHISEYLKNLLNQRKRGTFSTWYELRIVRDIKERTCYVQLDFKKEIDSNEKVHYILPGGDTIKIGDERFECTEAMFQPNLLSSIVENPSETGLHETVNSALMKCKVDNWRPLYNNIVLSGGSAKFKGLDKRLEKELQNIAPRTPMKINVRTPSEDHLSWIGGSILGSLSTFRKEICISKEEYDETGCLSYKKISEIK